ncbi:hypothetical protein F2Q70_00034259 [Brassica cretica]|uniref:Uncharacterized protein n=1 Tax=Brassica cretica TaxID=69181 RepID=A0A8S9K2E8_BRACR|nr:hypothetical protein F2Q70_00034259 [Brassica cretica]KAF3528493.1 hypothetical protein DY000_02036995 [Brassica cretica]
MAARAEGSLWTSLFQVLVNLHMGFLGIWEVDEVLRLGVYALIDSCSVEDQGPCRNYLAALKEDHKLNFKFEGKV